MSVSTDETHRRRYGLMAILGRHKFPAFSVFLAGMTASYALLDTLPVSYSAQTILRLEYPEGKNPADVIASEIALMQTPARIKQVADMLALTDASAPDMLRRNITVKPLPDMQSIEILARAQDAETAAALANTVATTYTQTLQTKPVERYVAPPQPEKSFNFLTLRTLQEERNRAEIALKDYKNAQQETFAAEEAAYNNKIEDLQNALQQATQNKESFIEGQKKNPPPPTETAELQSLRRNKKDLQNEIKKLSERYGAKHPKMVALNADLRRIDRRIQTESENLQTAQDILPAHQDTGKLAAFDLEIATLEDQLQKIQPAAANEPAHDPELENLMQKRDKAQKDFDGFLEAQKKLAADTSASQNTQEEKPRLSAQILAAAIAPSLPDTPDKKIMLAYATPPVAALAILVALFLERRRRNFFHSADEIETDTGLPCFAMVPQIDNFNAKPIADYVLAQPDSGLAESVRSLRMQMKLRWPKQEGRGQIIMVCSALPQEGKTTLAAWLGKQTAQGGTKTLLIDTDLRQPFAHSVIGTENALSLIDCVTERKNVQTSIQTQDSSGLHFLAGRAAPSNAIDVLTSPAFRTMLAELRKTYDLIILDTPASLTVPDSRALATHCDGILACVRWGNTQREIVHSNLKQIQKFSTAPIALVLANVDVKKHAAMGYGDVTCAYVNDLDIG